MSKISIHLTSIPALAALACGATVLRATPVLIDNFSDDLAAITSNGQLDGSMLGGESDFQFGSGLTGSFAISGGSGALSGVSVDGYFSIVYDGEDNNSIISAHDLPDIDLTDGGSNDRIAIDLTSVTGSIDVLVQVRESLTDFSYRSLTVTNPGIVEILFVDFLESGTGGDFTAAKAVNIRINNVNPGESFEIDSIMARDASIPPEDDSIPDTIRPILTFLKKKNLKTPRTRHAIRGTASDNVTVARVEVKGPGQGWKRARLSPAGRWIFRTPRLKSGTTVFKVRAEDAGGNRSGIKRIRVRGQ